MSLNFFPIGRFPKNILRPGARVRLNNDASGNNETIQFPGQSEVKITSQKRTVSLGDAGEIEVPACIPFVGKRCFTVQGEGTKQDELGRSNGIHQVHSAVIGSEELDGSFIVKIDPLQAKTSKKGHRFKTGDRIAPNKNFYSMQFTYQLLDIPRYFDDESFSVEYPEDDKLPFTVIGFAEGLYEDGLFIPRECVSLLSKLNSSKKIEQYYIIEGPFVDNWTYNEGNYEVTDRKMIVQKKQIEDRFLPWIPQSGENGLEKTEAA